MHAEGNYPGTRSGRPDEEADPTNANDQPAQHHRGNSNASSKVGPGFPLEEEHRPPSQTQGPTTIEDPGWGIVGKEKLGASAQAGPLVEEAPMGEPPTPVSQLKHTKYDPGEECSAGSEDNLEDVSNLFDGIQEQLLTMTSHPPTQEHWEKSMQVINTVLSHCSQRIRTTPGRQEWLGTKSKKSSTSSTTSKTP